MKYFNDFIIIKKIKVNNISVLYFKVTKETPTQQEWEEAHLFVDKCYDYCEKKNITVRLFFNIKKLKFLKPSFYVDWADIFKKNIGRTKKYVISSVILFDNIIICYFINVFFSFYSPIKPIKLVNRKKDAIKFLSSIN